MNPVPSPALVAAMLRDPDTLTLDVPATSVAMGCAQSYGYRQVKSGAWPSIRHGRKVLVPAAWVRAQLMLDVAV